MHVLLLRPVPGNERFGLGPFFRIEPLGMEYIGSALEARGHTVTLADLRFGRSLERQLRSTRFSSLGLVGIAAMHALETDDVMALARRQAYPLSSAGTPRQLTRIPSCRLQLTP
jgi:hypothetical protein